LKHSIFYTVLQFEFLINNDGELESTRLLRYMDVHFIFSDNETSWNNTCQLMTELAQLYQRSFSK